HFHKISYGIEFGDHPGPARHAFYRREESAHQNEDHHEEPREEHGLLLGVGEVGDKEADPQHNEQVDAGEQKDHPQATCHADVEYQVTKHKTESQFEHAQQPERKELPDNELVFPDRGNVDLFQCADFFFPNDIHPRQENGDHGYQQYQYSRHHEGFIVQFRV